MLLAPDTVLALEFSAALANTRAHVARAADRLTTPDELGALLSAWRYPSVGELDGPELTAVRALRDRIASLWSDPVDDRVVLVNRMLAEGHALPRLLRHDGSPWHLHATDVDAPLARRMSVEAALAVADVIRTGETPRLRPCEAPGCEGLLVDVTRNRSKRFCGSRCGNRVHAASYRARGAV